MARISRPRAWRPRAFAAACLLAALAACATPEPPPTVPEAEAFLADAEARLLDLRGAHRRAAWVHRAVATGDTAAILAAARRERLDGEARLARAAGRFDDVALPAPLRRKIRLLRTAPAAVGPADPARRQELGALLDGMRRAWERSASCLVEGVACLDRGALAELFAESRETDERLDAWVGWRRAAAPGRQTYGRIVELANAGARELGFADAGARQRAAYDLPADAFAAELERVWDDVRPLYESLHCLVRARLGETYGSAVAPPGEAIPAHLLASPWGGEWTSLHELVRPRGRDAWEELGRRLEQRRAGGPALVDYGERFFRTLGFDPLPASFRERSILAPPDAGDDCRAGAWHVDAGSDVRIRMCVGRAGSDLVAVHRVLGRAYYQWAYREQDPLFRAGPAPGFADAVAGAIGLSMTPGYFVRAGLLERAPAAGEIGTLLRRALDTVAHVPFGLAIDRWRWAVFAGDVAPDAYNRSWWDLRRAYEGVRPPALRPEAAFDPGAAGPVATHAPTAPGVVGRILQFQVHRALCEAAGHTGPLHDCSVFESPAAGARLRAMLELGASRPWPDALEALAGTRALDAGPLLDYFAPLAAWLDARNAGRSCGWPAAGVTGAAGAGRAG